MPETSVEFAKVSYAPAGQRRILQDISMKLEAGTTTALLGRSGSGKTTLMRMVNGLAMPTGGSVTVEGKLTSDWNLLELRRRIGYVIQESGLFPHWNVARNAGLALELAGDSNVQRVDEVLGLAGIDKTLADRRPWQLSGGQRQRVGLARALAADPAILLMDEPFGALDPMTRAEMQDMLRALLKQVRKTVLVVTHDLHEALFLAQRIIFLEDGLMIADLRSHEVQGSTNQQVQRYLAASNRGAA